MSSILIIEDNVSLAESIKEYLGNKSYSVTLCPDGESGLEVAREREFDLVVLDLMLPGRDGISVLKSMRLEDIDAPLLILSSKSELDEICEGLEHGADAYLTKPFSIRELKARVDALLKRPPTLRSAVIKIGDLTIDTNTQLIFQDQKQIVLRKREFEIVRFLAKNAGRIITRDQLLNNIWDPASEPYYGTIDVHISNIRRKFSQQGKNDLIETVHGRGYMITPA
ncbi:MAG: response regulator transcription factor [Candidatus Dojkabacteria bacterium]